MVEAPTIDLDSLRDLSVADVLTNQGNSPFGVKVQAKLEGLDANLREVSGYGLIYELARGVDGGESLRGLQARLGIHRKRVSDILKAVNVPFPDRISSAQRKFADPDFRTIDIQRKRARWADPEFKAATTEAIKTAVAKPEAKKAHSEFWEGYYSDPNNRKRAGQRLGAAWKSKFENDPDFASKVRATSAGILRRLWSDPAFVAQNRERTSLLWQDENFREKMIDVVRENAAKARQAPDYAEKQRAGVRRKFEEDAEYKKRHAAASRQHVPLMTIAGFRSDIGIEAKSTWEANIARVLHFVGREWSTGVELPLAVTPQYKDLFEIYNPTFTPDFLTVNKRGQIVAYEIMAHPSKDPVQTAKLIMASEQHGSEMQLRAITPRFYSRLQKRFDSRINGNPNFSGWETGKDNLKNNPSKFG